MGELQARVLLVDGDRTRREVLRTALGDEGHEVRVEPDGSRAVELVDCFRPDVAVLAARLPRGPGGLSLVRRLRDEHDLPIVLVDSDGELDATLAAFEAGADEHLVEPFDPAELVARIGALLRRTGTAAQGRLQVADLVVEVDARRVFRGGHPVELSPTEFDLLVALGRRSERVISKLQLLSEVWGTVYRDPNVLEVRISSLRRKLEAYGPRLIHTVRGVGYRLGPPGD